MLVVSLYSDPASHSCDSQTTRVDPVWKTFRPEGRGRTAAYATPQCLHGSCILFILGCRGCHKFLRSLVSTDYSTPGAHPPAAPFLHAKDRFLCGDTIGQRRLFHLFTIFWGFPSPDQMGSQGRDNPRVVGPCGKAVVLFLPSFQDMTHKPPFLHFSACLTHMCFGQRCLQ